MKKYLVTVCILLSIAALTACASKTALKQSSSDDLISFEGTVFTYDGQSYDIVERVPGINTIMSCTVVDKNIVVEGHIGPKNGAYIIFNTETTQFEKDIFGNHLIWYDDDLSTAVYSFWSEIYNYDGDVIATVDMAEFSIIYNLEFVDDYKKVQATIVKESGSEEQQQFDL